VWDVNGLINNQVVSHTGKRVVISNNTADRVIGLATKGWVLSLDRNGSVIV
jgi:hypothetical protein